MGRVEDLDSNLWELWRSLHKILPRRYEGSSRFYAVAKILGMEITWQKSRSDHIVGAAAGAAAARDRTSNLRWRGAAGAAGAAAGGRGRGGGGECQQLRPRARLALAAAQSATTESESNLLARARLPTSTRWVTYQHQHHRHHLRQGVWPTRHAWGPRVSRRGSDRSDLATTWCLRRCLLASRPLPSVRHWVVTGRSSSDLEGAQAREYRGQSWAGGKSEEMPEEDQVELARRQPDSKRIKDDGKRRSTGIVISDRRASELLQ